MNTFWPRFSCPRSTSACHAVKPIRGVDAASSIAGVLRLQRHVLLLDGNELRKRTDAMVRRASMSLVTGLEARHARADKNHDAGHVVTQDEPRAVRP